MLFKKIIQHASNEFRRDARKTGRKNIVTKKHVIIILNKYIYDFSKTVFCFALSTV